MIAEKTHFSQQLDVNSLPMTEKVLTLLFVFVLFCFISLFPADGYGFVITFPLSQHIPFVTTYPLSQDTHTPCVPPPCVTTCPLLHEIAKRTVSDRSFKPLQSV